MKIQGIITNVQRVSTVPVPVDSATWTSAWLIFHRPTRKTDE